MNRCVCITDDPFGDMIEYVPFLTEQSRGKRVLEIGVRSGVSTAAFLNGASAASGHVYSVDRHEGCGRLFSWSPFWTFIHADSQLDVKLIKQAVGEPVDLLLIDGSHDYVNVRSDLMNYVPLVRQGGLLLMHDVNLSEVALAKIAAAGETWAGEPRRAMNEFVAAHPEWKWLILLGVWGLGVIEVGE